MPFQIVSSQFNCNDYLLSSQDGFIKDIPVLKVLIKPAPLIIVTAVEVLDNFAFLYYYSHFCNFVVFMSESEVASCEYQASSYEYGSWAFQSV
jgi:hypothetical protein